MKTAPFYPLGLKWMMFNNPSLAHSEMQRTSLSHSLSDVMNPLLFLYPKGTALLLQIPNPHHHAKVVSITKPEIPASAQQTLIPAVAGLVFQSIYVIENSCCALSCMSFSYMIPSKYPVGEMGRDNLRQ